MIKALVYFHGPLTEWQGAPSDAEIVARFESRWAWLAEALAMSATKQLNAGRCGILVMHSDGTVIKRVNATVISTVRL